MGSNSYKYDKELFELLKQEYKERLKIQLTLGSYEKLRSFINKETLDEELNRIDNKKKGHKSEDKVSEDSIKRHFALNNSKTKPSLSSCSLYARKLGYLSWDDFCEKAEQKYDVTKGFSTIDFYKFSTLNESDEITIGWYPKKYCRLKFLGEYSFEVVESYGMHSKIGRKFETAGFRLTPISNKVELPEVIIEPLFDDDPLWTIIENFDTDFCCTDLLL